MRLDELNKNWIIMSAISGSHAYGLNTPTSDVDHRGVFIAPKELYYGLHVPEQASDDKSDTVYYELTRFIDLLIKQNPNIIELLGMPAQNVEKMDGAFKRILAMREHLITRKIRDTFGGYAIAQIGKARGLNKKIYQPMDKEKKTPMDFCYVPAAKGATISLKTWLDAFGFAPENCGLAAMNHVKDGYALFVNDSVEHMRGVCFDDSNDVHLSNIPKNLDMHTVMFYNKDAYTRYCKDYKEYWEWVEKRNPARYEKNMEVGKGYDTKNMMHCVRLLRMAEEMLRTGELHVYREHDREELLDIRNGLREYDDLVAYAEGKLKLLDELVPTSPLPEKVDEVLLNKVLIEIRDEYYTAHRI